MERQSKRRCWSYFRLDFAPLASLTSEHKKGREELYLSESGRYQTERNGAVLQVTRYLRGSFVITAKTSAINDHNGLMDGYSGIHIKMDASEYRAAWELAKNGNRKQLLELLGSRYGFEL